MHAQGTALPAGQGNTGHGPAGEPGRIAYTVAEVARLLGKHSNTVYEWAKKGALPSERIGNTIYIPKYALARLLPVPVGEDAAPQLDPRRGSGLGVPLLVLASERRDGRCYQAHCREPGCGWTGEWRTTPAAAHADYDRHLTSAQHHKSRQASHRGAATRRWSASTAWRPVTRTRALGRELLNEGRRPAGMGKVVEI